MKLAGYLPSLERPQRRLQMAAYTQKSTAWPWRSRGSAGDYTSSMRMLLLALTVFFLACCASAPPGKRVFNAEPLVTEGWYETLYQDVTACARRFKKYSGRTFEEIEFYVVPAGSMEGYAGLYSPPNRIYLDEKYVMNDLIIRHEEAHAALAAGHNGHTDPVFIACSQPPASDTVPD